MAVRKSAVWGTDVYTDDSDIVASTLYLTTVIIHSGHYRPVDAPDISHDEAESLDHVSSLHDIPEGVISPVSIPVEPLVAQIDPTKTGSKILSPDHDLHVTLRILPKLVKYAGATRHGLDSRSWGGSHDGESLYIESIEIMPRGSVVSKGRKVMSKYWGQLAKNVTKTDERHETPDVTVMYSAPGGLFSIKYTTKLFENLMSIHEYKPPGRRGVMILASYIPYWKIKMVNNTCHLESSGNQSYTSHITLDSFLKKLTMDIFLSTQIHIVKSRRNKSYGRKQAFGLLVKMRWMCP